MSDLHTYNPDRIVVVFGGADIHGFSDGTFVEIQQLSDGISSKSGADGEIARAISQDNRHQVTITLLQTSGSNDVLSGYYEADRLTCGGTLLPILIQDLCGRTLFSAAEAWVVKKPNTVYSNEVSDRQWVIQTGKPLYFIGGNQ